MEVGNQTELTFMGCLRVFLSGRKSDRTDIKYEGGGGVLQGWIPDGADIHGLLECF